MVRPVILASVAAGGFLGACARYELGRAVTSPPGSFPVATFLINTSGSLALGIILVLIMDRLPSGGYIRPFAATGFIGAYTTWSTFMVEADRLVKRGDVALAAGYVGASLVAGLVATLIGASAVRYWLAASGHRGGDIR